MRRSWQDTLRVAADVALLGVLLTVAALPVVTAGAAVATASVAMHHFLRYDSWPPARSLVRTFARGLLPGLCAAGVLAAGAGVLLLNLRALGRGVVPGGLPLTVVFWVLLLLLAGYAARTVVAIGASGTVSGSGSSGMVVGAGSSGGASFGGALGGGSFGGAGSFGGGWRAAARVALRERPVRLLTAAGVVSLAGLLAVLIHPALVPVLAGFAMFALHVSAAFPGRSPGASEASAHAGHARRRVGSDTSAGA